MVRVLLMIPQRNFNEVEYSVTKKCLDQEGIETTTVTILKDKCIGMDGMIVEPEKTVMEISEADYDCLIIIGGSGTPKLLEYPEVLETVKRFNNEKKLIGAICLAPIVLAKAGVLLNTMVTVYPVDWAIATIIREGGHYIEQDVVEDGNIITAKGPKAAEKFAQTIIKRFKTKIRK